MHNEKGEFGTRHTFDTQNPQTYQAHRRVAYRGSWLLFKAALAGWVHGTFPEWQRWQFWSSTIVIKLALALWRSGRHDKEFIAIFGPNIADQLKEYRYGFDDTLQLHR